MSSRRGSFSMHAITSDSRSYALAASDFGTCGFPFSSLVSITLIVVRPCSAGRRVREDQPAGCYAVRRSCGRLQGSACCLDTGRVLPEILRLAVLLLVLPVGFQDQLTNPLLCGRVHDRPQQCKAPAFAIDAVLAIRKRDVPPVPCAPLPDGEADQLQSGERATLRVLASAEMQLRISQLAGRVPPVIRDDLDVHRVYLLFMRRDSPDRRAWEPAGRIAGGRAAARMAAGLPSLCVYLSDCRSSSCGSSSSSSYGVVIGVPGGRSLIVGGSRSR